MRFHFTTVPIRGGEAEEVALNRFLAAHRVVSVERHLVVDGERSAWAVCVCYSAAAAPAPASPGSRRSERVDYKDTLSPEHFRVFAELRLLRKELAERDGVPPYAVFGNEQLAQMSAGSVRTLEQLGALSGVGPARVTRYGEVFLARLAELSPAAAR